MMNPEINVPSHTRIKEALEFSYAVFLHSGGYRAVARLWGVSEGTAWKLINDEGYWPDDPGIRQALFSAARFYGIQVRRRGRKSDLWSMDVDVLLWKIINREEV